MCLLAAHIMLQRCWGLGVTVELQGREEEGAEVRGTEGFDPGSQG